MRTANNVALLAEGWAPLLAHPTLLALPTAHLLGTVLLYGRHIRRGAEQAVDSYDSAPGLDYWVMPQPDLRTYLPAVLQAHQALAEHVSHVLGVPVVPDPRPAGLAINVLQGRDGPARAYEWHVDPDPDDTWTALYYPHSTFGGGALLLAPPGQDADPVAQHALRVVARRCLLLDGGHWRHAVEALPPGIWRTSVVLVYRRAGLPPPRPQPAIDRYLFGLETADVR